MAKGEMVNKPAQAYWDCHVHVFGAPERYPRVSERDYVAPERLFPALQDAAAPHGVARFVLVQPSVYGKDHRCMLDALAASGHRHRCIAVLEPQATEAEIAALHALGVRGARFNCVSSAGNGLQGFAALAPKLRDAGWLAHVLIAREALNELAPLQRKSSVGCVLDHTAGLGPDDDASHSAWSTLRALLDDGNCWVKISGLYRSSRVPGTFADCDGLIDRLARLAPDRLLWGSDWPHTWFFSPGRGTAPQYGDTLAPLVRTLGQSDLLQRILVDHPERLYR